MTQSLSYLNETASQTAGPYVHIGLAPRAAGIDIYAQQLGESIAGPEAEGARISITGTVTDGTGAPVKDVLIEIWQADSKGHYPEHSDDDHGFRGWGRVVPDFESGVFTFETIKPGRVSLADGRLMAPHLNLWLVARGINTGLHTRLYFGDEDEANEQDPVLSLIEQAHRRQTLIAKPEGSSYRFDISLQGAQETVFFDV